MKTIFGILFLILVAGLTIYFAFFGCPSDNGLCFGNSPKRRKCCLKCKRRVK